MNEENNLIEENKNQKIVSLGNESSNQKLREEHIQNDIKMSNKYFKSLNIQEEVITNNLFKITCFLCLMIITISIFIIFFSNVKVEKENNKDEYLIFSFLHFSLLTEDRNQTDSLFCISQNCSFKKNCSIDINLIKNEFLLKCDEFINFRIASIIVKL